MSVTPLLVAHFVSADFALAGRAATVAPGTCPITEPTLTAPLAALLPDQSLNHGIAYPGRRSGQYLLISAVIILVAL